MMKRNIVYLVLVVLAGFVLLGCKQDDYELLNEEIAELEGNIQIAETENDKLKQDKSDLEGELEELNTDNREMYDESVLPYHCFDMTAEEYIEKILFLHNNPEELWVNGSEIEMVDELNLEKTVEHFTNKYYCEIFNFEEAGERCTVEISTLDTDAITGIKFTYYYDKNGSSSEKAERFYYNYTDIFFSAFIMVDTGYTIEDAKFNEYYEGFFTRGAYFEGNAWAHNYITEDGKAIVLEILPVGLQ